jgi:hypothetical protein
MRLPYVIDNQTSRLADVLAELLGEHHGKSLDVATAYFTVGGFGLIQEGLLNLGNLRLILGGQSPRPASKSASGPIPVSSRVWSGVTSNRCHSTKRPSGWSKI